MIPLQIFSDLVGAVCIGKLVKQVSMNSVSRQYAGGIRDHSSNLPVQRKNEFLLAHLRPCIKLIVLIDTDPTEGYDMSIFHLAHSWIRVASARISKWFTASIRVKSFSLNPFMPFNAPIIAPIMVAVVSVS